MVKRGKKHNRKRAAKQAIQATHPEPNKIGASTPYDFEGRNLTPYGGLLPVATMLEKLGLQQLLEATITSKRVTRVMSLYKFALWIVLGFYVGFQRLNQLRFIARDPIFFFKQKTAYEIGLGIPAEPLFRSAVQPDIEAERKKRDEIEAGKSYCSRRFGGATCDDKSAQIYARFDKNDWRIQPAEFYRFHDAEVNTFGYF